MKKKNRMSVNLSLPLSVCASFCLFLFICLLMDIEYVEIVEVGFFCQFRLLM